MARRNPETPIVTTLTEPGYVDIPKAARVGEKIIVRTIIKERPNFVGKVNGAPLVPRMWTGFYWIMKNGHVQHAAPIEYQKQEILRHINQWDAEALTQSYFTEVVVPDPEFSEVIDETAVSILYIGQPILGLIDNLNIPLISQALAALSNVVDAFVGDNLEYLPIVSTPEKIGIWFPIGCTIEVTIEYYRFSPISVGSGLAEIAIDDEILEEDTQVDDSDPDSGDVVTDFEEIARGRGFIDESECEVLAPEPPWKILFSVNTGGGGGTGGVRSVVIPARAVASVSITVYNPSTGAPTGVYVGAALGDSAGCTLSPQVSPAASNSTQWVIAQITAGDLIYYSLLYGTPTLSATPSAGVTFSGAC